MHTRLCRLACDRHRLTTSRRDLVIGGHGEFQNHEGTLRANAQKVTGMIARSLVLAEADIDLDPGGTEPCMALPADFRIRIFNGGYDTLDACGDHCICTGRRFAEMRTRLQRHIERCASCCFASAFQCLRLRMGPPAGLGPAPSDDNAIPDDDRAHGGIGPCAALPTPAKRQRKLHVAKIFGHWISDTRHSNERSGLANGAP